MPRRKQIHYVKALYHVMLRGNYRQSIFNDDADRFYFYSLLNNMVNKFHCKIHLFCLMTNHVHLIIEVNYVPLWKLMQSFSSSFSGYSNRKNNRSGHLFQGRYKAKLIQDEKYLLTLCYYIHRNPINAKMACHIDQYLWSSHLSYLGRNNIPWLTTYYVKRILKKNSIDKDYYPKFIQNKNEQLVERDFCTFDQEDNLTITDSINKTIKANKFKNFSHISIKNISEVVCRHLAVNFSDLSSENQRHQITFARSMITYFSHYYAHHPIKEIAKIFFRNPEAISKTMHRHLRSTLQKESIKVLLVKIEDDLKKLPLY